MTEREMIKSMIVNVALSRITNDQERCKAFITVLDHYGIGIENDEIFLNGSRVGELQYAFKKPRVTLQKDLQQLFNEILNS